VGLCRTLGVTWRLAGAMGDSEIERECVMTELSGRAWAR
jgi:hypothetical protein